MYIASLFGQRSDVSLILAAQEAGQERAQHRLMNQMHQNQTKKIK